MQLFVDVEGICGAKYFGIKKGFEIPKAFAFTMVETRGIEPLTRYMSSTVLAAPASCKAQGRSASGRNGGA